MTDIPKVVYRPKEVMQRLHLKESVFKKYIRLLENVGYVIQKNERGYRIYTENDIHLLERLIELSRYDGMTLEKAVQEIVKGEQGYDHYNDMTLWEDSKSHNDMTVMSTLLRDQEQRVLDQVQEMLRYQEQKAQEREQRLLERLTERDENLMKVLREVQETKKEIATAAKKKWWQFWK